MLWHGSWCVCVWIFVSFVNDKSDNVENMFSVNSFCFPFAFAVATRSTLSSVYRHICVARNIHISPLSSSCHVISPTAALLRLDSLSLAFFFLSWQSSTSDSARNAAYPTGLSCTKQTTMSTTLMWHNIIIKNMFSDARQTTITTTTTMTRRYK